MGNIAVVFNSGTVAAAGTNQGTAASLANCSNVVTGASGANGVILPTPKAAGQRVSVYSSAATNALLVYPPSGGTINDGTQDAALSVTARTLKIFEATSTTNWST